MKAKRSMNGLTVPALVTVIIFLGGMLLNQFVGTAQGLGDVRCDVATNSANITTLQEQYRDLRYQIDRQNGYLRAIAHKVGAHVVEEDRDQ